MRPLRDQSTIERATDAASLIDAVARALWQADHDHIQRTMAGTITAYECENETWELCSHQRREAYMTQARVAIQAIGEAA